MPANDILIRDMTGKCTNCGNCRIVCPVFKIKGSEQFSSRGRINLIRGLVEKDLRPTKELKERIFCCLDCRQCISYCPSDVDYVKIMSSVKLKLKSRTGSYRINDILTRGLFSSDNPSTYFSYLRLLNKILLKAERYLLTRRFSLFLRTFVNLPENISVPETDFFGIKKRHKVEDYKGIRTAVFIGCGGKFLYPDTADRFIGILRRSGIEAVVPKDQVCCGKPLIYSGLSKNISSNLTANFKAFNRLLEISCMISLCSGSTPELKKYDASSSTEGFRFDVRDFTEFLTEHIADLEPEYEGRIIFHSCPKCGDGKISENFVKHLYRNRENRPEFSHNYCGSTELLNRFSLDIRSQITKEFCEINKLDQFDHIACSSFECIEYLNEYFNKNNMKIRALHFVDAVRA